MAFTLEMSLLEQYFWVCVFLPWGKIQPFGDHRGWIMFCQAEASWEGLLQKPTSEDGYQKIS